MSFPRYERYKDSGVGWLGKVPENWQIFALKRIASLQSGETIGPEAIEPVGEYPVYGGNGLRGFTSTFTHNGNHALIGRQGALCGNVNYASGEFWASEHAIVVTPIQNADTTWLGELLREMNLNQYSIASAQPGLSVDNIRKLFIAVPTLPEQQAIGRFLRHEMAKIDTLIEEQRRLIELLKEKRQAVISYAVTKGLEPEASLSDSGVASFGFVPSHWAIRKVHALAKVGNGSTPSRERFDYWNGGEYPWLSSTVVNQEEVTQAEQFVTELALKECHLPKISPPAVLIGITGQGKTRGMATTLRFEATINQHIAAVVPRTAEVNIDFLRPVFDMLYVDLRTDSEGGGSTKGAITCEQIQSLRIALPPIAEQIQIASWIQARNKEFAALIGQAESAIELLQERRSALISAAVTGKIDVRNYTSNEAA